MKRVLVVVVALFVFGVSANATVLSYDGFETGGTGYTVGNLPGQSYDGSGYAAAGSWTGDDSADSAVNATGLSYSTYFIGLTGGKIVHSGNGGAGTAATPDLTAGGSFGQAGLSDGSHIGGTTVDGVLYISYLAKSARSPVATDETYAGMQLYRDAVEVQSLGGKVYNWWDCSIFGATGDQSLTNSAGGTVHYSTAVRLCVAKITFNASADDDITVWQDPDPSDGDAQGTDIYRYTASAVGDLSFNKFAFRAGDTVGDSSWDFDELRFGTNWTDATAPVVDDLISFEPFAGYNTSDIVGQTYKGSGYASGSWAGAAGTSAEIDSNTLVRNSNVDLTTGGKVIQLGNGDDLTAAMDTAFPSGDFAQALMINSDSSDNIGGGSVDETLYVSFLARAQFAAAVAGVESAYAGLSLFRDGAELQFLGGNNWGAWAYSLFGKSGPVDLKNNAGTGSSLNYDTTTRRFVAKIKFNAGAADDLTVWLDPVLADGDSQGAAIYMYSETALEDLSFDAFRLRAGSDPTDNAWEFDEICFGKTFESVWSEALPSGTVIFIK